MFSAAIFRHQRVTESRIDAAQRSIMFTESRRLTVNGDRGSLRTDLVTIDSNGLTIGRVTSTGHEIALLEADNITFLFPRAGRLDIRIGEREYRVASQSPMAFRPTERVTKASAGRSNFFSATTLQVPMARLRALAELGQVTMKVFAQDGLILKGGVGGYLAQGLPILAEDLFLRPTSVVPTRISRAIAQLIDEQLCEFMGLPVTASGARRVIPAFHRVQQAVEMMHAQSDDPVSILEIAKDLGISLRSLQLAFSEVYGGLSPREVLSRIRLEKARTRLLAANGNGHVTTVALDSGFFHLGRFANAYARAFGEKPSETLYRRRA